VRRDETCVLRSPLTCVRRSTLDLRTYLANVELVFSAITHRQLDRLFLMRDSYKFLDRLIHCFHQKRTAIERNRLQQAELKEKAAMSLQEEQQLREKLALLVSYTKQLKEKASRASVRLSSIMSTLVFVCLVSQGNLVEEVSKPTHQHHGRDQQHLMMLPVVSCSSFDLYHR
jgi:FtsZ-binding cell division protein ZapB